MTARRAAALQAHTPRVQRGIHHAWRHRRALRRRLSLRWTQSTLPSRPPLAYAEVQETPPIDHISAPLEEARLGLSGQAPSGGDPLPYDFGDLDDGWKAEVLQQDPAPARSDARLSFEPYLIPTKAPGPATATSIVAGVTVALMSHPPTALTMVEVSEREGVVTLRGQVDSAELKRIAEEIAAGQPNVRSVVNALEVKSPRRL